MLHLTEKLALTEVNGEKMIHRLTRDKVSDVYKGIISSFCSQKNRKKRKKEKKKNPKTFFPKSMSWLQWMCKKDYTSSSRKKRYFVLLGIVKQYQMFMEFFDEKWEAPASNCYQFSVPTGHHASLRSIWNLLWTNEDSDTTRKLRQSFLQLRFIIIVKRT